MNGGSASSGYVDVSGDTRIADDQLRPSEPPGYSIRVIDQYRKAATSTFSAAA